MIHNIAYDQKSAWFALGIKRLHDGNWTASDADCHITLFYVSTKASVAVVERIATSLKQRLSAWSWARAAERFKFSAVFNEEFADENYAWADIIVHSALHGTLHSLVATAYQPPMRKHEFSLKQATHITTHRFESCGGFFPFERDRTFSAMGT